MVEFQYSSGTVGNRISTKHQLEAQKIQLTVRALPGMEIYVQDVKVSLAIIRPRLCGCKTILIDVSYKRDFGNDSKYFRKSEIRTLIKIVKDNDKAQE